FFTSPPTPERDCKASLDANSANEGKDERENRGSASEGEGTLQERPLPSGLH
nr:hypothetical protein [Tanacetum cinerariifolium]